LRSRSTLAIAVLGMAALVSACAPAPVEPQIPQEQQQQPAQQPAQPPEITLNLHQEEQCVCQIEDDAVDYTFLEKGFSALAEGDYVDAVQYFQRYRRTESSKTVDWESDVAIAYVSSLESSPFYDAEAARKAYRQLRKADWQSMALHQQTLLMRQSLESFIVVDRRVADLKEANAALEKELRKREEALKRLRELTLGQKGASR